MSLPMLLINDLSVVVEEDVKSETSGHSSETSGHSSAYSNQSSSQTSLDSSDPPKQSQAEVRKDLFQDFIKTLRPLPLEFHWTVWHDKHSTSADYESRLTVLLEDVATIGTFYQVYNNYPWDRIHMRDSVHLFRQGIKPVWEDPENQNGGCWRFRVPKAQAQDFFHELALLCVGSELEAAVEGENDHVLGITTSVRFNANMISVWNKLGSNERSINILKETIINGLSPHLRPANPASCVYKRHAETVGYQEAIEAQKLAKN